MQIRKFFWIVLLLFSTIVLFACDGGGGSSGGGTSADGGTGTVSFSLTDSTTDQYRAVYITIVDLQICSDRADSPDSSDNDCNWMSLDPPDDMQFPLTYNLLKLVNGVTEAIGSGEFSAGEYHQVRLIIGHQPELENNLLGNPHPEANYVILNDGMDTIKPLKVPSGPQTGLKLVHPFTVDAGEIKELILDFDACRSVVKAGNSGKYILKPTIKVIEQEDKVDIEGTVTDDSDPANPIGGASVSAQISDGLSATVIRSTTTDVEDTENDLDEGEYILSLLSANQTYNIVAYDTGKSPECVAFRYNDEFPELPLDFMLSVPDEFGIVRGVVEVSGDIEADFPLVITIYTDLECEHPDGEGYVEIFEVANITYNTMDDVFEYEIIDLPLYDSEVTYYVVASADGYIPDTGVAVLTTGDTEVFIDPLVISPGE